MRNVGSANSIGNDLVYGFFECLSFFLELKAVPQEHGDTGNHSTGISNAAARNVRCRAVNGLVKAACRFSE